MYIRFFNLIVKSTQRQETCEEEEKHMQQKFTARSEPLTLRLCSVRFNQYVTSEIKFEFSS